MKDSQTLPNGVYAAVLTPMHSDFSCDHKKLVSHCFELMKQGCTGVALFGTTDFKVFVGNEKHIIESVHLGGAGTICGIANLYPELICSLYIQGKEANCPNPVAIEAVFKALNGIPFIPAAKSLMERREGGSWHSVRRS
ncbi:MAG TPA: hypothetical protein VLE95_00620 [Chlamydiales bacterium]|nr:hypothetical protein [Chlamydiales bacterium]